MNESNQVSFEQLLLADVSKVTWHRLSSQLGPKKSRTSKTNLEGCWNNEHQSACYWGKRRRKLWLW